MLIAPEFAPITFSFGFLEPPIAVVSDELSQWYSESVQCHTLHPLRISFPSCLLKLEPLGAPSYSRLWVATKSPKWRTAYFDGFIGGGDPFPPISYLAKRLGCYGVVVTYSPQSPVCYYAASIQLFGPEETDWLNLVWLVSAMNDGGRWSWQRSGAQQSFEETTAYSARRVKNRLTPEMLRRYCQALEIPLDRSSFSPDCLLDNPPKLTVPQRNESIKEARQRLELTDAAT